MARRTDVTSAGLCPRSCKDNAYNTKIDLACEISHIRNCLRCSLCSINKPQGMLLVFLFPLYCSTNQVESCRGWPWQPGDVTTHRGCTIDYFVCLCVLIKTFSGQLGTAQRQ